jgi:flagellar biogenesis protein FliO
VISNVYKIHDGETVLVIGLTHEEVNNLVTLNNVLRLSPAEGQERIDGQPDLIIYSAKDEEALTSEMVTMFGVPGDDIPMKDRGDNGE